MPLIRFRKIIEWHSPCETCKSFMLTTEACLHDQLHYTKIAFLSLGNLIRYFGLSY